MYHAPTHHNHEANENVVLRITRKSSQHLPFVIHNTSLEFPEWEMFLPLKVCHLNLTSECKMLTPFKVHDLNIVSDIIL